MKLTAGFLFVFLLLQGSLIAQVELTGNLHEDSRLILAGYNQGVNSKVLVLEEEKSPVLGGLLSLIIPGAGQIYSKEYVKAAIFAGVEAILITTAIIYDNNGDEQTSEFENYADEGWSVVRYAEWINEYIIQDPSESIHIVDNPSLPPWERVDWNELNSKESGSHTLPPYGTQQYYELIGKYYQYSSGWDDYTAGANNEAMSPNFHFYSGMRGEANDYYNVASKAVLVLYVNHFLSALDGVWSAVKFNKNLAFNFRVEENYMTREMDFIPSLNVKYSF